MVKKHTLTEASWMLAVICIGPPTSSLLPVPLKLGWVTHLFFIPIFIAHLASSPVPFSQSLVTIVTSSPTLCWAMFLLLLFFSSCCKELRDDAGSVYLQHHPWIWIGGFGGNNSDNPVSQTHRQTRLDKRPKDRVSNPFLLEGSIEQLQEDKGKRSKRDIKNKHRYPLEGTDQIKSLTF